MRSVQADRINNAKSRLVELKDGKQKIDELLVKTKTDKAAKEANISNIQKQLQKSVGEKRQLLDDRQRQINMMQYLAGISTCTNTFFCNFSCIRKLIFVFFVI